MKTDEMKMEEQGDRSLFFTEAKAFAENTDGMEWNDLFHFIYLFPFSL